MNTGFTRKSFRLGTVRGRKHAQLHLNNQDAGNVQYLEVNGVTYAIGLISDGCTNKKRKTVSRTEVGANLLVPYAMCEIGLMLSQGVQPRDAVRYLFPKATTYLGAIARLTIPGNADEIGRFADSYLMCTLLGFIAGPTEIIGFRAGDGVIIINDKVHIIDQDNKPSYMAYHVMGKRYWLDLGYAIQDEFDVFEVPRDGLNRFAIASDGLAVENDRTEKYVAPEDLLNIHSYEPQALAGLQWWLFKRQYGDGPDATPGYLDDCTVIASTFL